VSRKGIVPIAIKMVEKKKELIAKGVDPSTYDWSSFNDEIQQVVNNTNKELKEKGVDVKVVFMKPHKKLGEKGVKQLKLDE
jgi:hypothetical protein